MTTTFITPLDPEPLPAYRRDPEAISIISSAPSYHSEAPTYRERRPSVPESDNPPAYAGGPNTSSRLTTESTQRPSLRRNDNPPRLGLPYLQYAPGFHARPTSNLDANAYNTGTWSSITTSSRQLHAVARRRASSSTTAILNSLSAVPPPLLSQSVSSISSNASSSSNTSASTSTGASENASATPEPLLPQEDPALVGEIAATRARNARLYRERCLRGEDGFRQEGRTWDFMLNQMADWDERERSWKGFREQVGRTKLLGLGRRIGLRG